MPARKALTFGERFGRLVVVGEGVHRITPHGDKIYYAKVRCDCGVEKSIAELCLRHGLTKSCGCLLREWRKSGRARLRHGMTETRTHRIWSSMLSRCSNPKQVAYARYGARGIRVCNRWHSFDSFLADMGECPEGMSIDRINGKGNYKPGNCRWATLEQQGFNNPQTVPVILNGEEVSFAGAARRLHMLPSVLSKMKKRRGLTYQQAVDHYAAKCAKAASDALRAADTPRAR